MPQIKSQEETQHWDWIFEPAASLSKSDEKAASVQVFIVWITVQRVSFSRNNPSHIISHILFTLPIYQCWHFSRFPFLFFVLVFLLLLFVSIHLMPLYIPLILPKLMGAPWPQMLSLSSHLENVFLAFLKILYSVIISQHHQYVSKWDCTKRGEKKGVEK